MRAIVVTDQAAGTAGMQLAERPAPQPAINDVVVRVQASGFVPTTMGGADSAIVRAGVAETLNTGDGEHGPQRRGP